MKLIDKQMIDQFIEVKKRGFEVCYSKNAIENTREFHIIDELFSRMLLERNINVAKHIIDETNLLANRTFDHEESLSYFKNIVKNYNQNEMSETRKPWWKFWL